MNSKFILFSVLFIFLMPIVVGCHALIKNQEEGKELILRMQSNKEAYQEDENINITFELTNNTNCPIKIFSYSYSPGFYLSAALHLKGSNNNYMWQGDCLYIMPIEVEGKKVIPQLRWEIIPPSETYKTTKLLHIKTLDSDDPEYIIPPDTYKIYSIFEFDKDRAKAMGIPIDKPDELSIWFGKVTSNTIKITIKPKE